jgi:N,N'-diacetyllegionaminate synthase
VDALRAHGCLDLTLLHCVTEYPAPVGEVNLRALHTLAEAFGLPVGYSDHTEGDAVAFAAVAMGARVIEKHFTLDRTMPGPDHRASLEPAAFAALVRGIRDVTLALGDGRKRPAPCELPNIPVARKSVVAVRPVARGAVISRLDLAIKRPGHGVAPADLERVVGRRAAVDLAPDDVITWEVLA